MCFGGGLNESGLCGWIEEGFFGCFVIFWYCFGFCKWCSIKDGKGLGLFFWNGFKFG